MFSLFMPDRVYNDIYEITPEVLTSQGIRALILDIDNTLVTYDDPKPNRTGSKLARSYEKRRHCGRVRIEQPRAARLGILRWTRILQSRRREKAVKTVSIRGDEPYEQRYDKYRVDRRSGVYRYLGGEALRYARVSRQPDQG